MSAPRANTLVRPYPTAIAGTPTRVSFDAQTARFELEYTTTAPSGTRLDEDLVTVVSVPSRQYGNGYSATVRGGAVTSAPCSTLLTLVADPGADTVRLEILPSIEGCD